jgi:hypothetical protein
VLADERVRLNSARQVELKLKTPWRDGTTHLVMSPLEFMQRLAALVPRPQLYLIRFGVRVTSMREVSGPPLREHGVLAPNAKLRPLVVLQGPSAHAQEGTEAVAAGNCEIDMVPAGPHRTSWARLLKRVFDIDMQHCPNCSAGELKNISAILERQVIEKTLTHLGLDPQSPPRGRAREAGQDRSHLSRVGRQEHLAPGCCNATSQPGRRHATRQRGTTEIRVNPEGEVARERHKRQRAYQSSHTRRHGRQIQTP